MTNQELSDYSMLLSSYTKWRFANTKFKQAMLDFSKRHPDVITVKESGVDVINCFDDLNTVRDSSYKEIEKWKDILNKK